MTDERQRQILDVLARSIKPASVTETDKDWWMRLWRAALTIEGTDYKADLLFHEAITYLASVSGGWLGAAYAREAMKLTQGAA